MGATRLDRLCDRLVNPLALTQGGTADTPSGTA
jgi:hypothetical protein